MVSWSHEPLTKRSSREHCRFADRAPDSHADRSTSRAAGRPGGARAAQVGWSSGIMAQREPSDEDRDAHADDDRIVQLEHDLQLAAEIGQRLLERSEVAEREIAERDLRIDELKHELDKALDGHVALRDSIVNVQRKLSMCEEERQTALAELGVLKADCDERIRAACHERDRRIAQLELSLDQAETSLVDERGKAQKSEKSLKRTVMRRLQEGRKRVADENRSVQTASFNRTSPLPDMKVFTQIRMLEEALQHAQAQKDLLVGQLAQSAITMELYERQIDDLHEHNLQLAEVSRLRMLDDVPASEQVDRDRQSPRQKDTCLFTEIEAELQARLDTSLQPKPEKDDVLIEFFFLTAMACKLEMIHRGIGESCIRITNEQLFERMQASVIPVPFFAYHDWIKSLLQVIDQPRDLSRRCTITGPSPDTDSPGLWATLWSSWIR